MSYIILCSREPKEELERVLYHYGDFHKALSKRGKNPNTSKNQILLKVASHKIRQETFIKVQLTKYAHCPNLKGKDKWQKKMYDFFGPLLNRLFCAHWSIESSRFEWRPSNAEKFNKHDWPWHHILREAEMDRKTWSYKEITHMDWIKTSKKRV